MKTLNAAVIGLGSMGLGMAASALRAGHRVSGYDVNAKAMSDFAALGGRACSSVTEAVRDADVVFIVVVNERQTEVVLFEDGGAVSAMKAGSVVVSSATVSPDAARRFAARANAQGVQYLDAPISGGAVKANAGELTVMASGSPEAFSAARPVLDAVATTVYELGSEAGIGSSFKVVNQLLAGVHIAAACEAITFARHLGLDIRKVYEVITKSAGNSWMFENRVPHVLDNDYTPRSAVSIFTKDLGIVSEIGRTTRFPTSMAMTALQMFVMTDAAGMGMDDDASVARMLAGIAGLDLTEGAENSR